MSIQNKCGVDTMYKKVLIALNKDTTLRAQYNELVKIEYSTEDRELRKCIRAWKQVLESALTYQSRKLYQNSTEVLTVNLMVRQDLEDYCMKRIQSKKT